jgi:hypothetical protein
LGNAGIIQQALDHVIAPRKFERFNRTFQLGIQLRNQSFRPAPKEPTNGREEKMRRKRYSREKHYQNKRPKGQHYGLRHEVTLPRVAACVNPITTVRK